MRESTKGQVLAALLRRRPASRKQLAEATGISPATVSRTIDQLIADDLVVEGESLVEERRGRRQVLLDIVAADRLALGIDLGGSRTRCVLVDLAGAPLASLEQPTPVQLPAVDLARWIAGLARQSAGDRWAAVRAVGIGLPGAVGEDPRTVSNAPNLPQIEDPAFLRTCVEAVGRPLVVDNDANDALLGEQRFGAAAGHGSAAMVTLGAGLGVGLAVDGRVVRGRRGLVGEFGQLPFGPSGERLETRVTGPAISARGREAGIDLDDPAALFRAGASDAVADVRRGFDDALVTALAAVAVACDPDTIVLGGGIAKSLRDDLPLYQERLTSTLHVAPTLVHTALGDFAGAAGAAVGALHVAYGELDIPEGELVDLPAAGALTREALDATLR
ncbi:ROK family transcriptional regulator [Demequina sp. NBRC 110057]|uniref:ROK family transcriptional regulator n=1 Tax=Demequina sp. NBRC 110057 TaxID=1570346 RepID=UPI000A03D6DE|nr:ROK family transcriptional regulator [Demequina sp. NBRC 110057]